MTKEIMLELLQDSGLSGCKPISTPLDASTLLHQDSSSNFIDVTAYRRLVGRLIYLKTTRPDIAYATQQISQFISALTELYYRAALHVLRYLKRSSARVIFMPQSFDLQILGFSDANWGGCIDTRRSISGYFFFIGQSLVSWKSKTHVIMSCSSAEAEYHALSSATCDLQWLCFLLHDLKQHPSRLPVF